MKEDGSFLTLISYYIIFMSKSSTISRSEVLGLTSFCVVSRTKASTGRFCRSPQRGSKASEMLICYFRLLFGKEHIGRNFGSHKFITYSIIFLIFFSTHFFQTIFLDLCQHKQGWIHWIFRSSNFKGRPVLDSSTGKHMI